jgi:succinate dehydrogenase/fumarate reductase cytochrome b subunit
MQRELRKAANSPWVERLARLGYLAKGVVYAVVGVLALQVAFGTGGKTTDTQGALATLAQNSAGTALLAVVAVGLVGYVLWRVVQAWMDPDGKGSEPKGLVQRGGYLLSAAVHAFLAVAAFRLVLGKGGGKGGDQSAQEWTARLMSQPFGQALVATVGIAIAALGVWQAYKAWKEKFLEKLQLRGLRPEQERWTVRISKLGIVARGVVFLMVGLFLVQAALTANPRRAHGLDGALETLAAQPFGDVLLALVAAGLVAYALYMAVEARYRRFLGA